jgi:hypothetical protein
MRAESWRSSKSLQRFSVLLVARVFTCGDSSKNIFEFFIYFSHGVDWVNMVRRPLFGLLYQLRMIDDECGAVGGLRIGRGNRSTRRKPAPSATLSTTNPTWPDPGLERGPPQWEAWAMARLNFLLLAAVPWVSPSLCASLSMDLPLSLFSSIYHRSRASVNTCDRPFFLQHPHVRSSPPHLSPSTPLLRGVRLPSEMSRELQLLP